MLGVGAWLKWQNTFLPNERLNVNPSITKKNTKRKDVISA
jgi:hypothetical protein